MIRAKIGHAGTLDPLATGVLIICTGKNTKRIDEFHLLEKEYTGIMQFGATTPSYDLETKVNENFSFENISDEQIHAATKSFLGEFEQTTPKYSSVFAKGVRSYLLVREGKDFEPVKRNVQLFSFEITKINLPEVHFKIVCGKGFYIRSLVHDFAKLLGSGAHLKELCRTRIGDIKIEDAFTIESFATHIDELKGRIYVQKNPSVINELKGFHNEADSLLLKKKND